MCVDQRTHGNVTQLENQVCEHLELKLVQSLRRVRLDLQEAVFIRFQAMFGGTLEGERNDALLASRIKELSSKSHGCRISLNGTWIEVGCMCEEPVDTQLETASRPESKSTS
jgi:hypothetical protein